MCGSKPDLVCWLEWAGGGGGGCTGNYLIMGFEINKGRGIKPEWLHYSLAGTPFDTPRPLASEEEISLHNPYTTTVLFLDRYLVPPFDIYIWGPLWQMFLWPLWQLCLGPLWWIYLCPFVIVVFVAFVTDIFAALCDSCCHAPKLDYRNYSHLGVRDQGLDAKNINPHDPRVRISNLPSINEHLVNAHIVSRPEVPVSRILCRHTSVLTCTNDLMIL